jgi:hypothetical protein
MADDHHRLTLKTGHAANEGGVISEGTIAMKFREILEKQRNQVQSVGPLGMAGKLETLPGPNMRIKLVLQFGDFTAQSLEIRFLGLRWGLHAGCVLPFPFGSARPAIVFFGAHRISSPLILPADGRKAA